MMRLIYKSFIVLTFHFVAVINIQATNDTISVYRDSLNQAQLLKAISKGNIDKVKALINKGIDPNICDSKGWSPLDYSFKRNKPEIANYLKSIGGLTFPKQIRDMNEGPFIRRVDHSKAEVFYLVHDSLKYTSSITSKEYPINDFPLVINNIPIDKADFSPTRNYPKGNFDKVERIFAIGDVHGEYDRIYKLLSGNKIVDENGNWNWGKGHLVFVGDIFDRGSKVNEILWLIFKLQKQAEQAGGDVHFIIGNHETMIFKGDIRYTRDEFYALCSNLGLTYSSLYDEKTIIGNWIRQMPSIIKINGFIFLHGGISPQVFEKKLTIDNINKTVWQFYNKKKETKNIDNKKLILGNKGVFWYRGFVKKTTINEQIDYKTLNEELEFYHAKAFIVGHTEVDSISTFHNKKVIGINIPFEESKIREQALLIEGDKLFVIYSNGEKKEL